MDVNLFLMQLNCYCIEIDIAKHTRPVLLLKLILQNTSTDIGIDVDIAKHPPPDIVLKLLLQKCPF